MGGALGKMNEKINGILLLVAAKGIRSFTCKIVFPPDNLGHSLTFSYEFDKTRLICSKIQKCSNYLFRKLDL